MKKLLLMKSCGPSWAIVLCAVALGLSGCASRLDTRGNLLDPDKVLEIQPGELTRDEVVEILGSPSSITAFGSDTWYYIAQRTETFAFFAPKVTERQVLVVKFSKDGKVTAVEKVGLEQGKEIVPVDRKTPTHGNKMTVLEQIVGNLGRFRNKAAENAEREREDDQY
ncbi:MAG: outer membrane protein assembly factor BamE [Proteobacteria bacterium]|nr:outer membrane protein assembly factor BamE [Pseudomonadota bacterium]